jgi:signal transduction histidine kinase/CheY-like chemotaxis protein
VDDDEAFGTLLQQWFERIHDDVTVTTELDPTRALSRLEHGTGVDAVLCDYRMPELTGIDLLEAVRRHHPDIPFVMVTGEGSESVASEAISAGVTDYFTKAEVTDGFDLFAERVRGLVLERQAGVESQRFGTLLEILTVPVAVLGGDGTTVAANALFEELLERTGRDTEEPLRFQDLVIESEQGLVENYVDRLRGDAGPDILSLNVAVPTEDGMDTYRAQMAAVPGVDGGREGILVVLDAGPDAKRFEATVGDIVEWATGPYVTVDDEWEITVVNREGAKLLDDGAGSLVGYSLWDFFPAFEDATFHDQLRAVKRTGTPLDVETYYAPTGTHFHVRAYQTSKGVAIYLQDVTARVERAAELERRAERLGEFASIVAHDLRNPIAAAKGYVDVVAEAGVEDTASLAVVRESIERAEAIIAQTLTFAEEGKIGDVEDVDLGTVAADAWDVVETGDATLRVASTVRIRADRSALTRILENLLRNSVEHGSTGSRSKTDDDSTSIRSEGAPGSDNGSTRPDRARDDRRAVEVVVGAFPSENTTVGFYVEDDGPGIPPAERTEVFETAYSTSPEGTGFGLAIVEQIAHAHGWSVTVTEGTAGGARFEFTGVDPVADAEATDGSSYTSNVPEEVD